MAKPWPKLHSVGQKIQHFFSVVKPSTKDTKYIQVGIIKKHLRANVLLFQDKRQSDDARERMKCWCKVTVVFFSRALTLIYSQHLVLAHILSPSLLQTNPQLSGYVWTVVSERTTDSWPLDKEVYCPEHGALILSSIDEQKVFWLPQVASSLLRPQGMCITIIYVALLAKWQL